MPDSPLPGPPRTVAPGPVPDVLAQVDALLDGVAQRPLPEHAEAYDAVHQRLQEALGRLDEG